MSDYDKLHISDEEAAGLDLDASPRTVGVHPKVEAAAWAGALTVVLVWVAGLLGLDVPAEVASAVTALIGAAAGWARSVA